MTLYDSCSSRGRVIAVGGDPDTHRRLADLGLIGADYAVVAKRRSATLYDFGAFRASVGKSVARQISVIER